MYVQVRVYPGYISIEIPDNHLKSTSDFNSQSTWGSGNNYRCFYYDVNCERVPFYSAT